MVKFWMISHENCMFEYDAGEMVILPMGHILAIEVEREKKMTRVAWV